MRQIRLILVAVLLAGPLAAQADVIQIGSGSAQGSWEIALVEGKFKDLRNRLIDQVWWGDRDLAGTFAEAFAASYRSGANDLWGPYFAYDEHDGRFGRSYADVRAIGYYTGWLYDLDVRDKKYRVFATAERVKDTVSVPEPGSLALLSLGLLGMGMACRRRIS